MKLSILDQSVSVKGKSQDQTINETLNLSSIAEKMGYHRFWVSEHHNHPTIVGTAPEILMAAIAIKTKTIRIIKTGIFAYTRNPIYLSFVLFHFSMFLVFENVMYFISSIGIFFWINNYVIFEEEKYLTNTFSKEFKRYCLEVKRWLIF